MLLRLLRNFLHDPKFKVGHGWLKCPSCNGFPTLEWKCYHLAIRVENDDVGFAAKVKIPLVSVKCSACKWKSVYHEDKLIYTERADKVGKEPFGYDTHP